MRERKGDIPELANIFLRELAIRRRRALEFAPDALTALTAQPWAGNVRELKNVVERAGSLADGNVVRRSDLFFHQDSSAPSTNPTGSMGVVAAPIAPGVDFKDAKQQVVEAFELQYLRGLLERHEGNITRSASEAGLTRYHLRELLKRHGLNIRE